MEPGKLVLFAVSGGVGGLLGAVAGEVVHVSEAEGFLGTLLRTSVWTALIAVGVALSLMFAQSIYLSRSLPRLQPIVLGVLGATLAGAYAGLVAQFIFGFASVYLTGDSGAAPALLEGVRVIAWAVMGALLGGGLALAIPNFKISRGVVAGALGAAIGGGGFILLSRTVGDVPGRWSGAAVVGACLGAMLVWIETAFREYWLELDYGPRERRTVSLGKQPVLLGSDKERCAVYVYDAAPVALKYVVEGDAIRVEDAANGRMHEVSVGDRRQLGRLAVTVRGAAAKTRSHAASPHPNRFVLRAGDQSWPLVENVRLSASELGLRGLAPTEICAEVVRNPANPDVLGLKNFMAEAWQATTADGQTRAVQTGKSVKLSKGTRVAIGPVWLHIE